MKTRLPDLFNFIPRLPNRFSLKVQLGTLALLTGAVQPACAQAELESRYPARNMNSAYTGAELVLEYRYRLNAATGLTPFVHSSQSGGRKAGTFTVERDFGIGRFIPAAPYKAGERVWVTLPFGLVTVPYVQGFYYASPPSVYQFTAAATGGTGVFSPSVISTAVNAYQSALADTDGDGDLDLLVACPDYGVYRFANEGYGRYAKLTNGIEASKPKLVKTGDMDNDGDLDVVAMSLDYLYTTPYPKVSVNFNNGNGTFASPVLYDLDDKRIPTDLELFDGDSDGDLDVYVTGDFNKSKYEVVWRPNNGAGVLGANRLVGSGTFYNQANIRSCIAPGDADNDDRIDMLVPWSENAESIKLLRNNGTSSFGLTTYNLNSPNLGKAEMADLDGDGDLDAMYTMPLTNHAVYFRNTNGNYTVIGLVAVGARPENLALADLDGDGDLDLITANAGDATLSVRFNNGSGIFSGSASYAVSTGVSDLTTGDVDDDGDIDVVVTGPSGITLLRNTSASTVTSFAPASGPASTIVTITGTNLYETTAVTFNGVAALFSIDSPTRLVAYVPAGASTGPLVVTTASGALTAGTFTVLPGVVSCSPERNATRVSQATNVAWTYALAPSAATAQLGRVFSAQAGGRKTLTFSTSGTTVTADPAVNFQAGEVVTAVSPGSVRTSGGAAVAGAVHQFTTAVRAGNTTFGAGTALPVGSSPQGVAAGDVDGDGDLDVLTANYNDNTVSVQLNTGGNTYAAAPPVPVGSRPTDVSLADVDGDGDLDLLTANVGAGTVSVCRNAGNGTFGAASSVVLTANPQHLSLADLDADGDLDLVAASSTGNACLRFNDGSGSFTGSTTLAVTAAGVAAGDLDRDGDLDLVFAESGRARLAVFYNTAAGFAAGPAYLFGTGAQGNGSAVVLADFNHDQYLDVAATDRTGARVGVLLNNGNGRFNTDIASLAVGTYPESLAAGDVDADGDLDLVVANASTGASYVSLRLNDGSGAFTTPAAATVALASPPHEVVLADVNSDNALDIVTANHLAGQATVMLGSGLALISSMTPTSGPVGTTVTINGSNFGAVTAVRFGTVGAPYTVNAANTKITLTVPTGAPTGPIAVVTPSGPALTPTFTVTFHLGSRSPARHSLTGPASTSVAVGFNRDVTAASAAGVRVFAGQAGGKKAGTATVTGSTITLDPTTDFKAGEPVQVSVTNTVQSAQGEALAAQVYAFITRTTRGSGSFSTSQTLPVNNLTRSVRVGDVNNDGHLDVLTGSGTRVSNWLNNGSGSFSARNDIQTDDNAWGLAFGDLNSDGSMDLVYSQTYIGHWNVTYYNLVLYSNGSTNHLGVPGLVRDVSLADMDRDGDLDIVAAINNSVIVYRRNNTLAGMNGISSTYVFTGFSAPYRALTADLDNDGDLDIVTSSSNNNSGSVILNNGVGWFPNPPTPLAFGGNSYGLAVGDVDGDGDLDVLATRYTDGTVAVRLNNGSGSFSGTGSFAVGTTPRNVKLADLDADGDLDAVVANAGSNTLSVAFNDGTGTFGNVLTYPVGNTPYDVDAGDFDGDGDLDLAVANYGDNTVTILTHNHVPLPQIAAFAPASGVVGTQVTLTGYFLSGVTAVSFNGVPASSFTVHSNTSLTATVPPTATAGPITVTSATGSTPTAASFRVLPSLSSFTPASGPAGTFVELTGTGLTGATSVSFGGGSTTFHVVQSSTKIGVTVPAQALTGPVAVTTAGGTAASTAVFTVTPTLTAFAPGSGPVGTAVKLTGSGLGGTTAVRFNGTAATSVTAVSATEVRAVVPAGATSGPVTTTTPAGTATSSGSFMVTQALSANPGSGPAGTLVTLTGATFTGVTGVAFNGVPALYNVVNSSTLTTTVPAGAGPGSIVVSGPAGSPSAAFTVTHVATAVSPARHAPVVGRSAPVAATFLEPTDLATAPGLRVWGSQTGLRALSFTGSGNLVTGLPARAFLPGETVLVSVSPGVRSGGGAAAVPQVYQFTAATGAALGSYAALDTLAAGTRPSGTVLADVDLDGDLDIVAVSSGTNEVLVYANDGAAGFGPAQAYPVGNAPSDVVAADVDNDGDLDLLTANFSAASSVSVLLNAGNGTFSSGSTITVGFLPNHVLAADVNGDGWLDVVTSNAGTPSVSVALNTGTGAGTFAAASTQNVAGALQHLALGDLDLDGDLDLVLADDSNSRVRLALNNGSGTFTVGSTSVAVGTGPYAVALADVNHDGRADLVTANRTAASLSVALATGAGTFGAATTVAVAAAPHALQVTDIDGDGNLDLVAVHNGAAGAVSVRLGDGTGAFSGSGSLPVGAGPTALALGDLDGDLKLDLVTANRTGNSVSVLLSAAPPEVAGFSPTEGPEGTVVTIIGQGLAGTTAVRFNGVSATGITQLSPTEVAVTVPAGATSGPIQLTAAGGSTTSDSTFSVTPTLLSFTPASGAAGTVVTLTGRTFTGATAVTFNGVPAASFTVNSATQITATAPLGVTTGPLRVTTAAGSDSSATSFQVVPTFSSFTPASAAAGAVFTLTGLNLTGATSVRFNGTEAASFTVVSDTEIQATLPVGTSSGTLAVTTPVGTAVSAASFTLLPSLLSFAPRSGGIGTRVYVTGDGFVGLSGTAAVKFNTTNALIYQVTSSTTLEARVLTNTTTGPITVTTAAGPVTSAENFTVLPGLPGINSITPTSGLAGTQVQISGSGLGTTTDVKFNGISATAFTAGGGGSIFATVPAGATTGPISITNAAGTAETVVPFTVLEVFCGTLGECMTTSAVTSTGANTWQYLLAPNGQVVAALKDNGTALGRVYAEFTLAEHNAPRTDAQGREYVNRNWHLVAQNPFVGSAVQVKFYGLAEEWIRYLEANDNDASDVATLSDLRVTQYQGNNENCRLEDNTSPTALRVLTPTATESISGTDWFSVTATVTDHFSEFYLHGGTAALSPLSSPLPVELIGFTAERRGPDALLRWATAQERNSAHFEVEASPDGRTFRRVGQVAGQGTASSRHDYAFTDANVGRHGAGLVYYRLRQVDLDGAFRFSPVRTVRPEAAAGLQVQALPNPFDERLSVRLHLPAAAAATLQLRDALGRLVWQHHAQLPAGASELAVEQPTRLPAGVYVLSVQAGAQRRSLKVSRQ